MLEFVQNNWQIIGGGVGTVAAAFTGWRIKKANTKGAELENIKKVRDIEKGLLSDMEGHIVRLVKTNEALVEINEKLEKTIKEQAALLRRCNLECNKFNNQ